MSSTDKETDVALDPEIDAFLAQMQALAFPAFGSIPVADMRGFLQGLAAASPGGPEVAVVRDEVAEADGLAVPVRFYAPEGMARALILFLHGGGWALGSVTESDAVVRVLANRLRCAVLSVDYRLAPEHPFPAAADDAFAAVCWAAGNVDRLIGRSLPIIICGDSAGANLAAVATLRARDAGGPSITGQILINPSTTADVDRRPIDGVTSPFIAREEIAWLFDQYAPDPAMRRDARFAPLRAASHAGLPPALILTAEHDLLREDGEAYARKLAEAGVLVTMRRFPGAIHSWLTLNPDFAASQMALADLDRFVGGLVDG